MIPIKSENDIQIMREGGCLLKELHLILSNECRVGVTASMLDNIAYTFIKDNNAEPSFLGYSGYEYSTCISKNEEIVHGIPYKEKVMFPGDICSIDVGIFYKGFHVDAARTHFLETVDPEVKKLVDVTEKSFFEAIKMANPGNKLGDISWSIQNYVESQGLTVVKDLYSHGVGKDLHEDPLIPNYGAAGKGITLKKGMTFAIEPMVNLGVENILTLADKWTIITADKKWSAHYENTIYIGESGPEVLTN